MEHTNYLYEEKFTIDPTKIQNAEFFIKQNIDLFRVIYKPIKFVGVKKLFKKIKFYKFY